MSEAICLVVAAIWSVLSVRRWLSKPVDKPGAERALIIALLIILIGRVANAQDNSRWGFNVTLGDTMVVAPLNDLRLAAAYRLTVDSANALCRAETIERASAAVMLHKAVEKSKEQAALCDFRAGMLEKELSTTSTELNEALTDVTRLRSARNRWAFVSLTLTAAAVVAIVVR